MKKWLLSFVLLFILLPHKAEPYYTKGNGIYNENDEKMMWNGVSWFGFETDTFAPHGLWSRSMDDILDQLQGQGYNLIRIPYTNQMFDGVSSNSIDFHKNPDLQNKKPIEILDILVEKVQQRGLYIYLDRHRPMANNQSALWYTDDVSEQQWIEDWVMLAKRYKGNPTIIGADLHNEPNGQASWGTGNEKTDWRLAAERAGNAILAANPGWLILVQGVQSNVQGEDGSYWWGGNLKGVKNYPVRLNLKNKVVYVTHDYGEGVSPQWWFDTEDFPQNLPALWDEYWGYIHKEQLAPVMVGEFGGHHSDLISKEGQWKNTLISYIEQQKLYWTYWSLNPNSGDTGGLLHDDWYTWDEQKQAVLKPIMQTIAVQKATFSDVSKNHRYYKEM